MESSQDCLSLLSKPDQQACDQGIRAGKAVPMPMADQPDQAEQVMSRDKRPRLPLCNLCRRLLGNSTGPGIDG